MPGLAAPGNSCLALRCCALPNPVMPHQVLRCRAMWKIDDASLIRVLALRCQVLFCLIKCC